MVLSYRFARRGGQIKPRPLADFVLWVGRDSRIACGMDFKLPFASRSATVYAVILHPNAKNPFRGFCFGVEDRASRITCGMNFKPPLASRSATACAVILHPNAKNPFRGFCFGVEDRA